MPLTVELPQSPPGRETRASSRARREAAEQAQTPLRAAATAEEAGSTTPFLSPTAHVARHQRMYFVFISCIGSALVAAAINFGIQTAVFSNSDPVHLFIFPNTIAGNVALTLVIQTTLTFLIGGTVIFEDVWQRRVAPLAASAAGCQWLRRLLAATSTVEVAAGALSRESRFCAAGSPPWQPQPLGLAAEVRPPTPAASLVAARRGSPCCRGCGAFLAGLFAWSIAIPDPIHCRSLTDVSAGTRARARVPLWSAIGGLIVRGLFWSPFLFIVFWPLWVGISAAIWGVDDYNNFPQPELIMTVFGFALAAVTTPLLAMCILFRSARYSMAPPS